MLYFCYGSNMLTARLRARCPGARVRGTGVLPGHALAFHKRSVDGSGKCSLVPARAPVDEVHGTLAEIPARERPALHRAEFLGAGYELREVRVSVGARRVGGRAFVAMPAFVDDALRPYEWYKALVIRGAEEHDLPEAYVAGIRAVAAVPDPDRGRAARHASLESAG
ncbi:MAG: gamma-glutamylcyclotransferase family protein [Planctomycetota bacterium]|jgi:hypothetical protein